MLRMALRRRLTLRLTRTDVRGRLSRNQTGITDFINQGTIADLESSSGFAPIPLILAKRLQNHSALHFADRVSSYVFQRQSVDLASPFSRRHGDPGDRFLGPRRVSTDEYESRDNVRKFPHVSRPLQ